MDLAFVDGQNGWAVGFGGVIYHTADAGSSWSQQTSGTEAILNSVYFLDSQIGIVVGAEGAIISTSDGGTTWTPRVSGVTKDLLGVFILNPQNIWAVGTGSLIIKSSDGGVSWAQEDTIASGDALKGISLTSDTTGLAAGSGGHIWQYGPPAP